MRYRQNETKTLSMTNSTGILGVPQKTERSGMAAR